MISKHTDISHTSTTTAILVVVSDGYGGYGDFLLGLKLASALKQQYIDAGTIKPEIYLVTQPSGKRKIEQLNGDQEFDIVILTPQTLQQMIELKKVQVGHIIETPILSADLMGRIDCALMQNKITASLTQVTEYSYGRPTQDALNFRKKLRNICYKSTIYSGFQCDEMGIVLTPPISKIQTPVLDEEIREPLMGLQSRDEYLGLTELSFQYSHDIHSQRPSATHFLNIHRAFIKNSSKNHDIIMIGSSEEHKFQAFLSIKDGLIADGFQSISFYNINTKTERFLYENGVSGRKYRVLYTTTMSHRSIMACNNLSSILVGASGDQSFGEAVSADKIGVYECLSHKYYFIQAYDAAMISTSQNNPIIKEMLFLLRFANTPETYQRLGVLIRSTENQALFSALNAKVIHQGYLIDTIMREGLQTNLAFRAHITKLLREGYQQEALLLFNANKEKLTVFDEFGGKSIIEYAIENDTFGDFTQYFLNIQNLLLQYIFSQKQNEALALIKEENIDPASKINGMFILDIAIANHCSVLEKQLTSMIKQQLLEETSCFLDLGEQRKALLLLKTHPLKEKINISVFERIHRKSLIQYAKDHNPEGVFSKHFDDEREVFFHYLLAGEYTEAAALAAKMLWSPYTKINGKYLIQICDDLNLPQLGADIRQRYHVELCAQGINPDAWEVVTLLKQGREQEALEYLLAQLSALTIFDLFNDTKIIDHAIQHNSQGPFALYFEEPKHRLSQCFFSKKYCEAAHIIREQRTLLVYPYTIFRGEYIIDSFNAAGLCWATQLIWTRHNEHLFSQGINPAAWDVVHLLDIGDSRRAFEHFKAYATEEKISIFDEINGKNIYQHIIDHSVYSDFAAYAQQVFLQKNTQEISFMTRAPSRHSSPCSERRVALLFGGRKAEDKPNILQTTHGFYVLEPAPIGQGGWGTVYSGKFCTLVDGKTQIHAPLAIKKISSPNTLQLDKEYQMFQKAYPDQFSGLFEDHGVTYLAMPRFNGNPLDSYLVTEHLLSIEERHSMVISLLTAMAHIHEQGVIHHDIKPKNILYDPTTKKMYIVDFGCAEEVGMRIQYSNIMTSKYAIEYMPPEYVQGGTQTHERNDSYAMSLTLAEILGLNKKTLVDTRLKNALSGLKNTAFKQDLLDTFTKNATLDEALFSAPIMVYHQTPVFKAFIQAYVIETYDFSSYHQQLGEETVRWLNAMQSITPTDRPSMPMALAWYKKIVSQETTEHKTEFKLGF